jgi:DsbC/DsbD-like thiol-disulfide interchange protein
MVVTVMSEHDPGGHDDVSGACGPLRLRTVTMRDALADSLMIAAVALMGAGFAPTAQAQDASAWDGEPHGASRLIAGATLNIGDQKLARAGIEIRLDQGWKTYWRYPGDSGVPPTLDFSGSENVKSVSTLWPAPERFADGGGGYSIGYRGDVVLPLQIMPNDATKPSLLHVKLSYAVCGKLCVPAEAQLALTLSGKAGATEPLLGAAEARVPRRVALGAPGSFTIASIHRESTGEHARVVVLVGAPEGVAVDLFAEGPTPDWALPLPQPERNPLASPDGMRRYSFELDGLPPGAKADGAMLKITAVSPTDAIEVQARLD